LREPRFGKAALGATINRRGLHTVLKCKTFDGACLLGRYSLKVICGTKISQISHLELYYKYTTWRFGKRRNLLIYIRKVVIAYSFHTAGVTSSKLVLPTIICGYKSST
jgi:hypothetical protein